jgi:hypothetical protein
MMSKMWYRIQLAAIALLSGIGIFMSDKILRSTTCPPVLPPVHDFSCEDHMAALLGINRGFFLKSLIITSLVLILFPERVYKWWRWFALVAVLFVGWTFVTSESGGTGGGFPLTAVSDIYGCIFSAMSVTIVSSVLLVEKIRAHNSTAHLNLYTSYVLAILFSFGLGAVTLWAIW